MSEVAIEEKRPIKENNPVSSNFAKMLTHYQKEGILPKAPLRIMSAGCGAFQEANGILEVYPDAEIVGVERDSMFLELLAAKKDGGSIDPKIRIENWDLTQFNEEHGIFNLIVVRNPDVHNGGWRAVFENLKKMLDSGGKLLITFSNETEQANINKALSGLGFNKLIDEENDNAVPKGEGHGFNDNDVAIYSHDL